MKICIVSPHASHFFHPTRDIKFGGAELQLYHLGHALSHDPAWDISFIVRSHEQAETTRHGSIDLHFYGFQSTFPKARKRIHALWQTMKEIDADIYIQRSVGIETAVVKLFCRRYGKKFVYMAAHDRDVMREFPTWMEKTSKNIIVWQLFKWALWKADLIIVQHEQQQKDLLKNFGRMSSIRKCAHRLLKNDLSTEKKYILWVGRSVDWKQPELFLQLATNFPKESFMMVCTNHGDLHLFEKMRGMASKCPNITFLNFVPFDQINDYFAKAKIFINTSREEGFPNTFIQAMQFRTPILSLTVNPDHLLDLHQTGMCANGNFNELQEKLKHLLSDENLQSKLGENGFNYVHEHHDIERIIEDDKKIFRSLVKDHQK